MPLIAGSVNITGGVPTGVGLAYELFNSYAPKLGTAPAGAKQQIADLCNSFAQVVVAHIVANATVTVSVVAGIPVATTGSAVAQVGTTTAPGAGTGMVL